MIDPNGCDEQSTAHVRLLRHPSLDLACSLSASGGNTVRRRYRPTGRIDRPMDTRHGKYEGITAALAERWHLDGDYGSEDYVNEVDGSGSILYRGPFTLSGSEVEYLRDEHEATGDELSALEVELSTAVGLLFGWDSQGFLYGSIIATEEAYTATVAAFAAAYADESPAGEEA